MRSHLDDLMYRADPMRMAYVSSMVSMGTPIGSVAGKTAISISSDPTCPCAPADCSKVAETETLVGDVIARFGGLDILVNNAGIMYTASVEQTTEAIWDAQLDLNLKGAFFLVRAALPEFRRRGRGKVINISSIWGIGAGPNCPAYCASKGGLENLTRALAVEIGRYNINVNSLAPGNIATPLNAHLRGPDMGDYLEQMRALTPTGRDFLEPDELTGTAVYLASADSDSVHGVTIPVDAGWGAW
jgi:NAD(P)-dependent dehydrogenase (short-subunit alcohol dehydrogenase family)